MGKSLGLAGALHPWASFLRMVDREHGEGEGVTATSLGLAGLIIGIVGLFAGADYAAVGIEGTADGESNQSEVSPAALVFGTLPPYQDSSTHATTLLFTYVILLLVALPIWIGLAWSAVRFVRSRLMRGVVYRLFVQRFRRKTASRLPSYSLRYSWFSQRRRASRKHQVKTAERRLQLAGRDAATHEISQDVLGRMLHEEQMGHYNLRFIRKKVMALEKGSARGN